MQPREGKKITVIGLLVVLSFQAPLAEAQEEEPAVLEVEPEKERLECPREQPALLIRAPHAGTMALTLRGQEDGSTRQFQGKLEPGKPFRQAWPQTLPTVTYVAELKIDYEAGQGYEGTMGFTFLCVPRIEVRLARGGLDLGRGVLRLDIGGPAVRAEALVKDAGGAPLLEKTLPLKGGGRKALDLRWPADEERGFGGLLLKLFDKHGTWVALDLTPHSLEVPHEEVVFENGKWDVRPSEEPKLADTLAAIHEELERFPDDFSVPSLYVVGYTDTVGSHADNLTLSSNRARAIARWFRTHGLKNPILYQGFGEEVLAVPTADETPEPANRRALYILTNFPPPVQPAVPRSRWQRIP